MRVRVRAFVIVRFRLGHIDNRVEVGTFEIGIGWCIYDRVRVSDFAIGLGHSRFAWG